jgi:hypothetical protein
MESEEIVKKKIIKNWEKKPSQPINSTDPPLATWDWN